jgi:hypothetical protein
VDVCQECTVALPDDLHPLDRKSRTPDLDRVFPEPAWLDSCLREGLCQVVRIIRYSWHHD